MTTQLSVYRRGRFLSNRKILYTAFDVVPSPKGASTHITYFTRGLVEAGHDVTLLTAGDAALPLESTYAGATLRRVSSDGEMNFLKRTTQFSAAILDQVRSGPDYVVAHARDVWGAFPLVQGRRFQAYRVLFEVNGLPSIEMKYHYPGFAESPLVGKIKERELAALHSADAIICVAHVTATYLSSLGVDGSKITVIPNGVDIDLFRPTPLHPLPAVPTLMYVGTLAEWQGLATLVQALPHIVTVWGPVRLRIIGRARKRQRKVLEKMARKLGVEAYLSIEEAVPHAYVPQRLAEADVCIAPLGYNDRNVTQGCCPIKVLEYGAVGRPTVAANLPVVRELVREDQYVLLFNPDSPGDLARAVLTLLRDRDRAARLAHNAAEHVRQHFTWQHAQNRLIALYAELMSR